MSTSGKPFSVVLSTYRGDDEDELTVALDSVFDQTCPPDEVLLVTDGPLSDELDETLELFEASYPDTFRVYRLDENVGRGYARRVGVENVSHDIVAMMDADDVCRPYRFERQLEYLSQHPEVDIVGSYYSEFAETPDNPHAVRVVPTDHDDIASMARHRSPMNQVTVMFRKEAVLSAGNYRNVQRMEDYGLWVRMLRDGATFANIPESLVDVRASEEMYGRRGGTAYAKEELRLQYEFYQMDFINLPRFLFNVVTRVPIRLVPHSIRGVVYSTLFRSEETES